jgi:hypothetical protein
LLERLEDRTLLSTYTVNSTLDDGSSGTLRWAITQANTVVTPGVPNTIDFNLPSSSTIKLETALPNLSATNIVIQGPGASSLIVERDPTLPGTTEFSVFTVNNGATVSISGLTIADGLATDGGGIYNAGTLTVTNSTISDNSATDGGGIYNAGTLTVTNSTLATNSATDGGGIGNSGTLTVTNSTLSANSANYDGGGIANGGTAVLDNTIVALNTDGTGPGAPADDIAGTVDTTNSHNNLIGTGGAGGLVNGGNGNLVGVSDPGLAPLGDYGGSTQTMALLAGSPAIDAGSATIPGVTVPTIDQRGAQRGPAGLNAGLNPDIGAYEASSSYLVTNTDDDGSLGSLRAAVGWADVNTNANPSNSPAAPNTIEFGLVSPSTINLETALPDLSASNIAVQGPGASSLTVERDPTLPVSTQFSVFVVDGGATVAISGLTIAHGLAAFGGGIGNSGTLTVTNSTLADNSANILGGGIANFGTVTVTNSTLADNSTPFGGGGIANLGTVTVANSTLSDNSASGGGGILNFNLGTVTVTNSTITTNSASNDGGGIYSNGTATVTNSTITTNSASNDGGGIYSNGTAAVTNSTLSENSASNGGGGIDNNSDGTLTITNSTLSDNSTISYGGGIDSDGTATITNSALSDNSASYYMSVS